MSDESTTEAPVNEKPSKSARKRELLALQGLADQMATLSDSQLRKLNIEEALREAIAELRAMRPSGARNRQIKHCVKLMDPEELQEVRVYIADQQSKRVGSNQVFHEIERWRDRLIEEGDTALEALFTTNDTLDRQHVRRLCRDAVRERESGKPAGAGRKLFRYLKDAL